MCVEGGSEAEGALLYTDVMGKREQGGRTVTLTRKQLECSRQEMGKLEDQMEWKCSAASVTGGSADLET